MADTPVEFDVNTDDLGEFNELLNGSAAVKESTDETKKVVDLVEDADALDDDLLDDETDTETDDGQDDVEADDPKESDDDEDLDIFKPKPKPKQTVQARINELTRKNHDQERAFAARLADLEAKLAASTPAKEEQRTTTQSQRPSRDPNQPIADAMYDDGTLVYPLGEFDPNFIADLTTYNYDKRDNERQAQRDEEMNRNAQQTRDAQLATEWETKLVNVEKDIPDLRPTIQLLDAQFQNIEPSYGTYLVQTLMSMDNGPEVLFYLANNPDEAAKIVASGPQKATLSLGRLEARVQAALAKKATPAVRQTRTSAPPTALRGNGAARSTASDTDDLAAFEKQFYNKK